MISVIGSGDEMTFLYVLAVVVTGFAIVQDLREREVSNWLNFSFIAVALGYRAFFSSMFGDINFFIYGVLGFALMFVLSYVLYYGRAFAGGDAKLLMGYGVILPYVGYKSIWIFGIGFIFLVFFVGFIWSLLYSVYFINGNKRRFKKEWNENWKSYRLLVLLALIFFLGGLVLGELGRYLGVLILFLSLVWVYIKSLDGAMKVERRAGELREGDWIEENVKIGKRVIKTSVHGLSLKDIEILKKYGKGRKILIKEGIPFTPAFLGALIVTVFFLEVLMVYLDFLI
jgi:Flp pilus assembly protein protease CpaA